MRPKFGLIIIYLYIISMLLLFVISVANSSTGNFSGRLDVGLEVNEYWRKMHVSIVDSYGAVFNTADMAVQVQVGKVNYTT